jgi:molecular chaperone GrpE
METAADKSEKAEQAQQFRVVDRRPFANLGEMPVETVEQGKPRYPSFVEELMAKLKTVEDRFEEKKKQIDEEIARTKSRLETDYGRRFEKERHQIVLPFLEVLDNLERAILVSEQERETGHLHDGVCMTANLFRAHLKNLGVESIAVLDQPFDPNIGQAVGMVSVEEASKDGIVIEEVLRGYTMGNQLLRAAMVRVGQHSGNQ